MNIMQITAILALCAGCCYRCECGDGASTPAEPASAAAKDGAIALAAGESHQFFLEENVTTGFSWEGKSDNSAVAVELEHLGPEQTDPPLCGAPGRVKVTIAAKEGFKGEAKVTLVYRRPWEGGETAETKVLKVVAR